ncbi:MAG: hypothetical protein R3345_09500 [Fulvivirga sp.]|nr:hypothetical protein [Fulvivirga sp.]
MFVPFEEISDNARLWIYQADRKFNDQEVNQIENELKTFVNAWAAHGAPLQASFKILHNQFVVLAVDEAFNAASGCSIDDSVHIIKVLEDKLKVNFFDRTKIAFIFNNEVFIESLSNLKTKVEEGTIKKDTLTFNNLVKNKRELETQWVVPAKDTWISRYFD